MQFLSEPTAENIVKIGQYLAKIWTKYDSLLFWATLYTIPKVDIVIDISKSQILRLIPLNKE